MYDEIETILFRFSSWTPDDVKKFTVRERRYWAKKVRALVEREKIKNVS